VILVNIHSHILDSFYNEQQMNMLVLYLVIVICMQMPWQGRELHLRAWLVWGELQSGSGCLHRQIWWSGLSGM